MFTFTPQALQRVFAPNGPDLHNGVLVVLQLLHLCVDAIIEFFGFYQRIISIFHENELHESFKFAEILIGICKKIKVNKNQIIHYYKSFL